jgi:choline dehydrogenase-like flavoprotein
MNEKNTTASLNLKASKANTYDVIVIGSGISGGWAAKEFCELGLKTLVLERGRSVEHLKDYPTAMTAPWEFPHRNQLTRQLREDNPIVSRCYAFEESTQHFFVKDKEHPYEQTRPFDWIRGYQVGGRSLTWGRWTQRWSDHDFDANLREGIATDWPIRYADIAPWYSHVEKFAGISGNRDGLAQIPDGEFLPPTEMTSVEKHLKSRLAREYQDRHLVVGRMANLSVPHLGRGSCQNRNLCFRGCPFGGYFSSNSATLPAAEKTGNLTLRPFSVVHSIIYDEATEKATGVRVIDANTKESIEYFSKIVFVNGSTLNSTLILLNSTSSRFPNGMGNDSGELGHNLMDHNYNGRVSAQYDGFDDEYYVGRRPGGTYIPRFRNFGNDKQTEFLRGYAFACITSREMPNTTSDVAIGASLAKAVADLGPWSIQMVGMGECLPNHDNKVTLSKDKKDDWGVPLLNVDAAFGNNEAAMLKDILISGSEMLEKAGFTNIKTKTVPDVIGLHNHEMGTARMGTSPKNSVLNRNNQVWGASNVFVTDGACMTSGGNQNPSLTYMALTARAAHFAVNALKKREL